MKVYNDSNYNIRILKQGHVLRFGWNEGHESMTYEDFQEACSNFIGYALENHAKTILIDVRNFKLQLPPEFPEWQKKHHHPRYHKAGIEKVVYLMPEAALEHAKEQSKEKAGFEQKNFSDEDKAVAWLSDMILD